ncbi:hypothetical protein B0T16DRAFT_41632 [Cercophora newfieldiana]|uniref:Uncharacterized protein n=1 Tax=Cercophora newfieldiana TaxID=92897 RepID=A0AA39YQ41_9PEZI|nr:hypothetical protein B0T16DRAFT_41632 [Cercophora newfieldiana]
MMAFLTARQYRYCDRDENGLIDETTCSVPFWYTKNGVIVKWSLFLGFITFIGLYLLLGYLHAQKRIKKGLRPLAYHRFLVTRRQMATIDPAYQYPQAEAPRPYFYNQQYFGMQNMPPPPVYDPTAARPPNYPGPPGGGPPDGASKVDPIQQNAPEYQPPAGPPPGAVPQQNTGSNPFRL